MQHVSTGYRLIENLINTGNWHKEHCSDSCAVSLHAIKEAIEHLYRACWPGEIEDIKREVAKLNWS